MIELILSMMTPTPTPTPTPMITQTAPYEDPYGEEEEEEEEKEEKEEDEPTPTPTSAPVQVANNHSSVTNNPDKTTLQAGSQIPSGVFQALSSPARQYIIDPSNGYLNVTNYSITFELPLVINSDVATLTYSLDEEIAGHSYVSASSGASATCYQRVGGNTDIVITDNGGTKSYHYGDDATNYDSISSTATHYRLYNANTGQGVYIRKSDGYVSSTP